MRMIALEEHYRSPMVRDVIPSFEDPAPPNSPMAEWPRRLDDLGDSRVSEMDRAGLDVQVLSHTWPSTEMLPADQATDVARAANDYLADAVRARPDRLAAFATLPTAAPQAAADELERTVKDLGFKGALINGRTQDRFLDDQFFWPIFARAERLDVPIYLHPSPPPAAVRSAYYNELPTGAGEMLSLAGWGWHVETGLHVLRLIVAGVFEQFPGLQLIIGHMGEALPFMLARSSGKLSMARAIDRPLEQYVAQNLYFTTSGMFTVPPLLCLLMVAGADRVMFAIDYPISANEQGTQFLAAAPISTIDREKIAHGNAERLLGL